MGKHNRQVLILLFFVKATLITPFRVQSPSVSSYVVMARRHQPSCFFQTEAGPLNAVRNTQHDTIIDFSKESAFDMIDRLDDAIMGGVSTSSVQPSHGCAMWAGVCRTDGGYVFARPTFSAIHKQLFPAVFVGFGPILSSQHW